MATIIARGGQPAKDTSKSDATIQAALKTFQDNQQLDAIQRAFGSGGTQQEQLQRLMSENPRAFLSNAPALKTFFDLQGTDTGASIPDLTQQFGQFGIPAQTVTPPTPTAPTITAKKTQEVFFESLEEIQAEIKSIKAGRKNQLIENGVDESVADSIVKEDLEFLESQKRGLKDKKAGSFTVDKATGKAAIELQKTVSSEADKISAQVKAMQRFRREITESDRLENFLQSIPSDKARERFRGTEKSKRILARGVVARAGLDKIVEDNVKAEAAIEKTVIFGDEIGVMRDGKFVVLATKKPGQIFRELVIGNNAKGDPIIASGFVTPGVDAEGIPTGGGTFKPITIGGKDVTGIKGGGITVNIGGDPQPATERQELLDLKDIQLQINDLRRLFKPEFVGFMDNLGTKIRQGLGFSSKDRDSFARILPDIQNQIVFLRSGKAITKTEMDRLRDAMPKANSPDDVFLNDLEDFERVFTRMLKIRVDALAAQGFAPSVSAEVDPSQLITPQGSGSVDTDLSLEQIDAEIEALNKELGR